MYEVIKRLTLEVKKVDTFFHTLPLFHLHCSMSQVEKQGEREREKERLYGKMTDMITYFKDIE